MYKFTSALNFRTRSRETHVLTAQQKGTFNNSRCQLNHHHFILTVIFNLHGNGYSVIDSMLPININLGLSVSIAGSRVLNVVLIYQIDN